MIIKITISDEDAELLRQLWEDPIQRLNSMITEAILSQRKAKVILDTPVKVEVVI